MYKLFPVCLDGDQIRLTFSHKEELRSFEKIIEILSNLIPNQGPINPSIELRINDIMPTSLDKDILTERYLDVKKVLALDVLNVFEDYCVISRRGR